MPQLLLYPHTHWDREWYWSFDAYQAQLVHVVQDIINKLESGQLPVFMLDGQTSLVDDALALRPELGARVKALVKSGKMTIGPWFVLADQMLVSGESLIRNLARGLKSSIAYGVSLPDEQTISETMIGYNPDTFGHSADLPQILRLFGIDKAVVWRGVPDLGSGDQAIFDWQSPSGDRVFTLHLGKGYYQTGFHENVDKETLSRYLAGFLGFARSSNGALLEIAAPAAVSRQDLAVVPVGGDHVAPPERMLEQLEAAIAEIRNDYGPLKNATFVIEDLAHIVNRLAVQNKVDLEPIRSIAGELRDNASAKKYERAYMLPAVLSSRLYLKADNRRAEHLLLRSLEPREAVWDWHGIKACDLDAVDQCWRLLLLNQPHDSICGCSADSVHVQMQARTLSLVDRCNLLARQAAESLSRHISPSEAPAAYGLCNIGLLDPDREPMVAIFNGSHLPVGHPVQVSLSLQSRLVKELTDAGRIQLIEGKARHTRDAFLPLSGVPVFKELDVLQCYVMPDDIAPLSVSHCSARPGTFKPVQISGSLQARGGLALSGLYAEGKITAFIDRNDDLVLMKDDRAYRLGHRFIDVADGGDSYNFDPLPKDYALPRLGRLLNVEKGQHGPLVASLIMTYEIVLPQRLIDQGPDGDPEALRAAGGKHEDFVRKLVASPKTESHQIEVEMILKAGVPILQFETKINNQSADHRLSVEFSLADCVSERLDCSQSENHFSLLTRPHSDALNQDALDIDAHQIIAPGYEAPLDRYPCQRYFIAGGLVFLNKGLPEYGVSRKNVSITLLRSTSYLSRSRLRTRGGGAGPDLHTPQGNCFGWQKMSYGIGFSDASSDMVWPRADFLAETYQEPLHAMVLPCLDDQGLAKIKMSMIRGPRIIDDAKNEIRMSAFYKLNDAFYMRLQNMAGSKRRVQVQLPKADRLEWSLFEPALVNGLGMHRHALDMDKDGIFAFELDASELVTVKIVRRPV